MNTLIVDYNPSWPINYNIFKYRFMEILSHLEIEVEHVGSTAVHGLPSKDIIDIDIIYKNQNDFESIKHSLEMVGYTHYGNQGLEGREVFKRSGHSHDSLFDKVKHHLYVCHVESKELQRHLLSRDFLRKNEIAKNCYRDMKYACAKEAENDKSRYAEIKQSKVNNFINYIIELEKNNLSEK